MSDRYPSQLAEKIVVRLPDGMRDRLAAVAKANNRSVNAEVVAMLEASLNGEVEPRALAKMMEPLLPFLGMGEIIKELTAHQLSLERSIKEQESSFRQTIAEIRRKISNIDSE